MFFRGCCGFCEIVKCDVFRKVGKVIIAEKKEEGGTIEEREGTSSRGMNT